MSANTLTGLIPTLYEALDVVSRELVGLTKAVARDVRAERVAKDQTITVPVTPTLAAEDVAPANNSPETGGITVGNTTMTISKSRAVPFNLNGEETKGLGPENVATIKRDLVAQALRTLCGEIETDLAALYASASRAYGTAGTAPFGTAGDLSDVAQIIKIMQDNGAPMSDLRMVLNTTHSASLRGKQSSLFKVNEAGDSNLLRNGSIGKLQGFDVGETSKLGTITKGTGSGYLVNNGSGYAVGATTIALDTGSGTVLAGDIVTFAGDSNKYVVKTALSGGSIVLQEPGLRATLADNVAMTVGNNFTPSMAFHRGALQLALRAPALPDEGDAADDRMMVVDPHSGLQFEFSVYRQYRQVRYEVAAAWGVKAVAPRFLNLLLG